MVPRSIDGFSRRTCRFTFRNSCGGSLRSEPSGSRSIGLRIDRGIELQRRARTQNKSRRALPRSINRSSWGTCRFTFSNSCGRSLRSERPSSRSISSHIDRGIGLQRRAWSNNHKSPKCSLVPVPRSGPNQPYEKCNCRSHIAAIDAVFCGWLLGIYRQIHCDSQADRSRSPCAIRADSPDTIHAQSVPTTSICISKNHTLASRRSPSGRSLPAPATGSKFRPNCLGRA